MTFDEVEHILQELDSNLTIINKCASGSVYYRCGSLKVRVSQHFKKNLAESSSAHLTVTIPGFDGPAIVLLDKSLFPVVIDSASQLLEFLRYEKMRRDTFFPLQGMLIDDETSDMIPTEQISDDVPVSDMPEYPDGTGAPWNFQWPLGIESRKRLNSTDLNFRDRYKDVKNVGEFIKELMKQADGGTKAGNMVSIAYKEAGQSYSPNKYKEYKTFTGSYRELVYFIYDPDKYIEAIANY